MSILIQIVIFIPITLIALTFHEFAHGIVARWLGDPTAKYMGRLSLNPIRHIDPIGAICMILFRFGWAKPVPINPSFFKNPKKGLALSALAGPLMNLILAFIGSFIYVLSSHLLSDFVITSDGFLSGLAYYWIIFTLYFVILNTTLAIFNLIPIPPLDGSRVLFAFLPEKSYISVMQHEAKISIAFFLLLFIDSRFLGGNIASLLLTPANYISDAMISLFSLIF